MYKGVLSSGLALFALGAIPMFAASVCPAPNGGDSGGEGVSSLYMTDTVITSGVVQNDTGCNVLITFGANGSITTTFPNAAPSYDAGGDDNLIGVVNDTGSPISSINLSSAIDDIFGFDGDGICGPSVTGATPGYTFVGGGNPCMNIIDTSDGIYGGPGVTFSSTDLFSGTVSFAGGIASGGGTAWFSLEGPVDVNLSVAPGVPEPASVALCCAGLAALAMRRWRRSA